MMEVTNVDKYYSLLGIRPSMISDSIFGNVYVLANLDKSNYPKVFIGYSTKKEQFYLFNCIYLEDAIYPFGKLVEYIVVDLTSEDLFKIVKVLYSLCAVYLFRCAEIGRASCRERV